MLATRLVATIEKHAAELTRRVVHELQTDTRTPSYHRLDSQETYARVFNVVSNLGAWLDRKSDVATETAYRSLGQRRFCEGIPLSEVVYALMLTERVLRTFIQAEGWAESALELHQQVELYNLIDDFFRRAVYFTVVSYEEEARSAGGRAAVPQRSPAQRGWGAGKPSSIAPRPA